MRKIAFYINSLRHGGAERVICNLATNLSENGYECVLVTSFRSEWEYPCGEKVKRITLFEKPLTNFAKRNIMLIKKLRSVLKSECPNVLISFMAEPNFRSIVSSVGLPVKKLISVRNDPNKEYAGLLGRLVGKVLLPMADGCVFQTADAQKWFPKRLQKKSRIIYNPVKEDFYHVQRKPVRGEIVTCGRLESQKNHALLLDAFAQVVKKYPFATLKIYGEGSLYKQLQMQIENVGLQGKVFLMGTTDNVPQVMETAELFVLSSNYEGMPNALMEAMAAGVPCISTDCPCGGPKELFGDEFYGRLVPVENVNLLAEAICEKIRFPKSGDIEKGLAEKFQPEKVNAQWRRYIFDLIV